jgi:hypothetical protein
MACTFIQQRETATGQLVNDRVSYVGVLTDILVLDYGQLPLMVVVFKGVWADPKWSPKSSASMRYAESGLWQVNFQKQLRVSAQMDYVMPRQVEQVFFHPNKKGKAWRTVLQKEARSHRVHGDYDDVDYFDTLQDNPKVHADLVEACRGRSEGIEGQTSQQQAQPSKRKRRV